MATDSPQPEDRWQTIRNLWQDNRWLYGAAGFLLGLVFFPALERIIADARQLLGDLVPEAVGIVFTVAIIDRLYQRREEQRRIRELKEQLIRDFGSSVNDVAVKAAEELRRHGWLHDGSLQKSNLMHANLQGARLQYADLQRARLDFANLQTAHLLHAYLQETKLYCANLQGADLLDARLQGARLDEANLQGAYLAEASLREANLNQANLQEAILFHANLGVADLRGANLRGARLEQAYLRGARFNEKSILPDGGLYNPEGDCEEQLIRFTDPDHPDFWRPELGSVWWYPAETEDWPTYPQTPDRATRPSFSFPAELPEFRVLGRFPALWRAVAGGWRKSSGEGGRKCRSGTTLFCLAWESSGDKRQSLSNAY